MKPARTIQYLAVFLTLVVVTGGDVTLSADEQPGEQSLSEAKTVVARVNGEPIYEEQLKAQFDRDASRFGKFRIGKGNPVLDAKRKAQALDALIGNLLVNQEAAKVSVDDMDAKVDERVKALEKKFEMERYLKLRHLTMEELRESLKPRVRMDEYLKEHGVLEPEIPEERIREMYDADPDSFSKKEAVTASHILIAMAAGADPEQLRQKAERIRKEVMDGKDFAEAAKEFSECHTASAGGDLGAIEKGFMPPEFDAAAFSLEEGAVSEVVRTKYGYHIIKVRQKQDTELVPYDQMREFLKKYLQEEESKKKLAEHIAELKEKSEIEILLK